MRIFTNQDIKKLFISLACILFSFMGLSQLLIWPSSGSLHLGLFLLSLLIAAGVLASCFLYFRRQDRLMEEAISQISRFLTGHTHARIECDSEGSLYKLFHAVNTLATTLDAHAAKEQKTKEFLKDTISDISHQLKTPLAALNIYNGLLQDDSEDPAAIREFAIKSEREIDRIETLVQSLLKITKWDAGSIQIEKSPENIADMLNDLRLHFETRVNLERKTVTLSGPPQAELVCDRGWILEAVSNVVKNALDHTEAGGHITIEWNELPSMTQITVKDNGSGIHPEDIHHIFKRFYRSRFSKNTQGIGLGLPLTKAIVEAHDGTITVASAFGNGAAFEMSFLNLTKP
ncbi:MAG: HAMP domain-containing sensor histidine kinase [Paenibacillus macerans]|uniref:histidine kinase n=1 Tax=Paenibacillus macerans TaxID=44252 RepID=A0A090ZAS2_PAEMA|nr:HAMP domain-containing sensor histidine kinase [Paenibacillus macerans]KFN08379.1 his Kinase A domain protein [Paenibacillus macerans]MBS5913829.1 HAMP domain-containing histidine kinase [Paenibacillus macerans]MCY7557141.1 HAMP domain-containing histidine kinase [Paenibacillus macerans]MDU7473526.1 HAMP domain-containing sensor histidine kinase [Paenibacillus macerans]MEC0135429.1 HAMP domain-containing sensor histidine kinase [Paenibacillus macerans]